MLARPLSPGRPTLRPTPFWLGGLLLLGCDVQASELIFLAEGGSGPVDIGAAGQAGQGAGGRAGGAVTAPASDVVVEPLDPALVEVIDERPIGGASLGGGTTGGGDYATAFAAGRIFLVHDIEGLEARLGDDEPAILLLEEGDYAFTGTEVRSTCVQACDPTTPVAQQTIISGFCTNDEAVTTTSIDYFNLEVGANKTLIGLGGGARLTRAEVNLSKGSNVILRNLSIRDVAPDIAQFGYGIRIWPSHHVWLDHLTIGNVGHGYVTIASDYDSDTQVITQETGYITITACYFDGHMEARCGQRSPFVVGTNRDPAITFARNWFDGGAAVSPSLFGPGTWGHVFNNYWTDIDGYGLGVSCGAEGLLQGNVFERSSVALYIGDDGSPTWAFCSAGLFGNLYAPMGTGDAEENLFDSESSLSLRDQPTAGGAMTLPVRVSGERFSVSAPVAGGAEESYAYELAADPGDVRRLVPANAGVGKLF